MNSKSVGNVSEAKSLAKFVELGWVVLIPFGDNEPYDFVIDRGNGFERVQVKTGRAGYGSSGSFLFNASSISEKTSGRHSSYVGKIDLFAVYLRDTDKVYLVPISAIGSLMAPMFRTAPALNSQKTGIRLASDFEI